MRFLHNFADTRNSHMVETARANFLYERRIKLPVIAFVCGMHDKFVCLKTCTITMIVSIYILLFD